MNGLNGLRNNRGNRLGNHPGQMEKNHLIAFQPLIPQPPFSEPGTRGFYPAWLPHGKPPINSQANLRRLKRSRGPRQAISSSFPGALAGAGFLQPQPDGAHPGSAETRPGLNAGPGAPRVTHRQHPEAPQPPASFRPGPGRAGLRGGEDPAGGEDQTALRLLNPNPRRERSAINPHLKFTEVLACE